MDCFILEDELTRNDSKYGLALFNMPEMPRSYVHRGASVRSRVLRYFLKSDQHLFFSSTVYTGYPMV